MVQELRKLCEQISLMLRTVDEQMGIEGWEAASNTAKSYTDSLLAPKKWIPYEIFRLFKNKEYPHLLAYVSVLLDDDIEGEYAEEITEPLVTAGYFDYGQGKHVDDNWEYGYVRWYGYMENHIDDGRIYQEEYKDEIHITQEQWKQFDKYWHKTEYTDLTINAFSKILGKDIQIPEGIEAEKNPDDDYANQKVADVFYETVKAMKPKYPFRSYKCFGYPLVSVTNATDVESKIVKPLLALVS